jgi:hypothetical protein
VGAVRAAKPSCKSPPAVRCDGCHLRRPFPSPSSRPPVRPTTAGRLRCRLPGHQLRGGHWSRAASLPMPMLAFRALRARVKRHAVDEESGSAARPTTKSVETSGESGDRPFGGLSLDRSFCACPGERTRGRFSDWRGHAGLSVRPASRLKPLLPGGCPSARPARRIATSTGIRPALRAGSLLRQAFDQLGAPDRYFDRNSTSLRAKFEYGGSNSVMPLSRAWRNTDVRLLKVRKPAWPW